jgi:hypothetical protein
MHITLTLNNVTFRTLYVCGVHFDLGRHSNFFINRIIFVVEVRCVFCKGSTDIKNIIQHFTF